MCSFKTAILNRLSSTRAEYVAYSRFFNNRMIKMSLLVKALSDHCRTFVEGRDVLCIQDTTELNYSSSEGKYSPTDRDLGPLGNDQSLGFFLHPGLVVDSEAEFPLGFSHVHCWNRSKGKLNKHERDYKQLPLQAKESYRWLAMMTVSKKHLKKAKRITVVGDRESDIYEIFSSGELDDQMHLLIRSNKDRLLFSDSHKLSDALSTQAIAGQYRLKLKGDKRIGRKSRMALLNVRFTEVNIRRPDNLVNKDEYPAYITLRVVEALEDDSTAPSQKQRIHWRLLTTHRVEDFSDARQMIRWYSLRWLIEQLFRTLKIQGLDVESSQLENGAALKKLVILALQAALKIMQLVQERDAKSKQPADVVFSKEEVECLTQMLPQYEGKTDKQKNPFHPASLAWAAWIIARMGGWKGYQRAAPPGPITMKRGLEAFGYMKIGWHAGKAN